MQRDVGHQADPPRRDFAPPDEQVGHAYDRRRVESAAQLRPHSAFGSQPRLNRLAPEPIQLLFVHPRVRISNLAGLERPEPAGRYAAPGRDRHAYAGWDRAPLPIRCAVRGPVPPPQPPPDPPPRSPLPPTPHL